MLDWRDLAVPVVAAPMAGGPSTPALVSAVGGAGGLGFLPAGYVGADLLATRVEQVREASSAPFGVNLFVVAPARVDPGALEAYARSLQPEAGRLEVELGHPRWDDDGWLAKLEVVLDVRPPVVSFTFGCPPPAVLRRLAEVDVLTCVTVTTTAEARVAAARGAASLSLQGPLAGAHRGTWDPRAQPAAAPLLELLREVVTAVDVPVLAGGGVASAGDVAELLGGGAVAAQAGTAYLLADEAGTNPVHRRALRDPALRETRLTRAYTGRWARALVNRFVQDHPDAPAAYPQVHHLTAGLRAAAVAAGDADVAHLWAGGRHEGVRTAPAADITRSLAP